MALKGIGHNLPGFAPSIEELTHNAPVIDALIGQNHVFGGGCMRLKTIVIMLLLFGTSERGLRLIYASSVMCLYLSHAHSPLFSELLETVQNLFIAKGARLTS